MPEVRPLQPDERSALLELLDGWQLGDGWRGRDFFRRYVEDDPTFEERNVWVATEGRELLSCAQIFPRRIRTVLGEQPVAGIGSVFTRRDRRGLGLASSVLEATVADLERRNFTLALLFAERVDWYRYLGWLPWCSEGTRLVPPSHPRPPGDDIEIGSMEPSRDLADVVSLHSSYSDSLLGTLVRDRVLWQASLRCAGNPDETFLVARRGGRLLAYLRAIVLDGDATLTEWGVLGGQDEALVGLIARIIHELQPATSLHLPRALDPALDAALVRAGYVARGEPRLTAMMRPLDPRTRTAPPPDEILERFIPRDRFVFWLSDRF